jgi:hypothetical protein
MRSVTSSLVAITSLFAVACGGSSAPASPDASSGGEDGGATPPSLAGRWISACAPSPQPDGSTQYIRLDFDIAEDDWALDYVVHGDAECTVPLVTVHVDGPYQLERPSASVDGAWEARLGFAHKTIRPEIDALRDVLNGIDGCGAADFETGVAQDVYESGCAPFGQYPRTACEADHDLVRVEGDALHFGARPADNDMCTAANRPASLSPLASLRQ